MNDGAVGRGGRRGSTPRRTGSTILGRITAYSTGAVDPRELFFAPIKAVKKLMKKNGAQIADYDLIEANEAFAIAGARGRPRAGVGLGPRERERRRDGAGPPDRRQGRPGAHHTLARTQGPGRNWASPHCASAAATRSRSVSRSDRQMTTTRCCRSPHLRARRASLYLCFCRGACRPGVRSSRCRCLGTPVPLTLQPLVVVLARIAAWPGGRSHAYGGVPASLAPPALPVFAPIGSPGHRAPARAHGRLPARSTRSPRRSPVCSDGQIELRHARAPGGGEARAPVPLTRAVSLN